MSRAPTQPTELSRHSPPSTRSRRSQEAADDAQSPTQVKELDSDQLVALSIEGDTAAFEVLVRQGHARVYNLCYRIMGTEQDAQDMTQEAYVRAWRALPDFRFEAKFDTWIHRIAVNTCLNRRRQLRHDLHRVDGEDALLCAAAPVDDPADVVISGELRQRLWDAVDRLSAKYRMVITMFYQEQRSYQEIAEMLTLPLGTVKAHLNRARRALAKSLRDAGGQDESL